MLKAFRGKKEEVLGLKCFIRNKNHQVSEAFIVGYENGKYVVREILTGCLSRQKNVYFMEGELS